MTNPNEPKSGVSAENLLKFESRIRSKLPDDFREFLLTHNGGIADGKVIFIPALEEGVFLNSFYGLNTAHEDDDIQTWLKEYEDDLTDNYIPIGEDKGGNSLLLDLSDGHVSYWDSTRFSPRIFR